MKLRATLYLAIATTLCVPAFSQDAKTVIADATKAMGLDGVNSMYYYGSGASYSLGQNNNANQPWPPTPLNDWVRAIDFSQSTARTTYATYAVPVTGGAAALVQAQQVIAASSPAGWGQQLEIWTTPWGFLKGAAANNATAARANVGGQSYTTLTWNTTQKSPGGASYKVVGYIGRDNLVSRVDTWLEHSIYGDMLVQSEYKLYRDNNGFKYPTDITQKRGGYPVFTANILGAWPNPEKLKDLMTATPPPGGGAGGPPPGGAPPPTTSEKLADGVYRIKGAYNSLAVEFSDHVFLFEPGPQNEARALAGIAETKRLFPGKPIKYGAISHHHFDHTGGLAAAVAEGITIVTPEVNKAFLEDILKGPRTLQPDALAKSGKKPQIEGFKGDKRVFQDATRTVELHVIKGLPHADGLIVAWLPKEKILAYADMFNFPAANGPPVANPPVIGTQVFLRNIERLGLQTDKILSIHSMNPDRLATIGDIRASMGLGN